MKIHIFQKKSESEDPMTQEPAQDVTEGSAAPDEEPVARYRLSWPVRCLLIVMLAMGITVFAARMIEYRELLAEKAELERQAVGYEDSIAEMREQLGEEMTREFIIRVARDKLHLYFPDDVIYYNDYNK